MIELYEKAVKLVIEEQNASCAFLQRRLGVGYVGAACLIDMMEARGVVGPFQGIFPREVLRKGMANKK